MARRFRSATRPHANAASGTMIPIRSSGAAGVGVGLCPECSLIACAVKLGSTFGAVLLSC